MFHISKVGNMGAKYECHQRKGLKNQQLNTIGFVE
jgi:hypothetical protein